MKWARYKGFTVVEVMLVLAISAIIFTGTVTIFRNGDRHVGFNQSASDLESKFRDYANQVSTGAFAGNAYQCQVNSSTFRPSLDTTVAAGGSSSQDCIYLGKAIQPIPGSSDMYVYDVVGLRNIHNGATDTNLNVKTYADAKPEPVGSVLSVTQSCPTGSVDAGGIGSGNKFCFLNTEKYSLLSGSKIIWAKTNGATANILKMYNGLQSDASTGRRVNAYASSYQVQPGDPNSQRIRDCIEEASSCTTSYTLETYGWDMCIQGSDTQQTAILSIKPTAAGLVTRTNYTACS
jgi:prepilin-type N-terminal cleavage/methylation domain-containing protein